MSGPRYSTPASRRRTFAASNDFGRHRDRDVLDAAEPFRHRLEAEAGEVEEGEHVAVADVEEEVRLTFVVTVLEQLDQREADQVLIEADRALGVGADRARGDARRRPVDAGRASFGPQVLLAQLAPRRSARAASVSWSPCSQHHREAHAR